MLDLELPKFIPPPLLQTRELTMFYLVQPDGTTCLVPYGSLTEVQDAIDSYPIPDRSKCRYIEVLPNSTLIHRAVSPALDNDYCGIHFQRCGGGRRVIRKHKSGG